jgi:ATP-dependent Clp protease ATP-binding subunit ClpA
MSDNPTLKLPENSILARVGQDITRQVFKNPVRGFSDRMKELDLIFRIMGSRSKGNPLIFGEAGVGKTFLVKCLAQMIVNDDVPPWLSQRKIVRTSFNDIISGDNKASDWSWKDYVKTLNRVIDEVIENRIILFMDEIHYIFNFPQSTNIIKPYLSDGSFSLIGATTFSEYRRYIEKDQAVARRFQTVTVEEPSGNQLVQILEDEILSIRDHYKVLIPFEHIKDVVKYSDEYMPYRHHPDKSIDILEQASIIASIEGKRHVDLKVIQRVISEITNLPEDLLGTDQERVAGLEVTLNHRVLGQQDAINKIVKRLLITKNKVQANSDRPLGVFLFTGPSGVGKTELAKAIAEHFTGSVENLVRVDMSIYKTLFSLHSLLGKPPNREEPSELPILTLSLRNRPFNVLLLDEIDKAAPEVMQVFLQVFDYGRLIDYQGNEIYFNNSVVIMTCNVLPETKSTIKGFGNQNELDAQSQETEIVKAVEDRFLKEFIGRLDEIIVFQPLNNEIMRGFVSQKIKKIEAAIDKSIEVSDGIIDKIMESGFHDHYGARKLNYAVDMIIGTALAELKMNSNWDELKHIRVMFDSNERVNAEGQGLKPNCILKGNGRGQT